MQHDNDDIDSGGSDSGGDDRFALDEIIGDSNNGAYQCVERRSGPPLSYVAEESRWALEQIHTAYRSIGDGTGDRSATQAAFHYCLVSYLALNNMLSLTADHVVVERLLAMSPQELGRWLDVVDAEGSVTG